MDRKREELLCLYLVVDLFILCISVGLVYVLNIGYVQSTDVPVRYYLAYNISLWILTFLLSPKEHLNRHGVYRKMITRIFKKVILFTILTLLFSFLLHKGNLIVFTLSCSLMFLFGELIAYWAIYSVFQYLRKTKYLSKHAVILGYNSIAKELKDILESNPILGYNFVGFASHKPSAVEDGCDDHLIILNEDMTDLEQVLKERDIEVVFSMFSMFQDKNNLSQQLLACKHAGVRLYIVPNELQTLSSKNKSDVFDFFQVINPQHTPLDNVGNRILKRTFDLLVSGMFLLLVFWWLYLILGVIIKHNSKGPVFFIQKRTGRNKKPFDCYKFRTMAVNKDADSKQATVGDPRITSLGQFLRKWNIDELPQLINVFLGHMSLVGPRPHMESHTKEYSQKIEFYLIRHYIKPGITGWAQVNGYRGPTDELWKMENRVQYDIAYMENWNFWWDIKIIWLTFFGNKAKENAH